MVRREEWKVSPKDVDGEVKVRGEKVNSKGRMVNWTTRRGKP